MARFAPADIAYGKLPVDKTVARDAFKLRYFVDQETAPSGDIVSGESFGAQSLVSRWGVFGSDKTNSSVFAAFANGSIAASHVAKSPTDFTDRGVQIDYAAASGYVAGDAATDIGITSAAGLDYWRREGLEDYSGDVFHLAGYAALKPRSIRELVQAVKMFGFALAGLKVYKRAEWSFKMSESSDTRDELLPAWTPDFKGGTAGRVLAPIIGFEDGYLLAVLWGKVQRVAPEYYERHSDEAWVAIGFDVLTGDRDAQGFKRAVFARALAKKSPGEASGPQITVRNGAVYVDDVEVASSGAKRGRKPKTADDAAVIDDGTHSSAVVEASPADSADVSTPVSDSVVNPPQFVAAGAQ